MKGRRLRLFVINDEWEYEKPDTQLIEIVTLDERLTGVRTDCLQSWHQHMQLWGQGLIPEFDLLLIDIKFELDNVDPVYPTEHLSGVNPYGLLHALPFVARQGLTHWPFVWSLHSGDPAAVASDPVAIFAFGLLCAMERRQESFSVVRYDGVEQADVRTWNGYSIDNVREYFSEWIPRAPRGKPKSVWPTLVSRYRRRLVQCVEQGDLRLSRKEVEHFQAAASRGLSQDLCELDKAALSLRRGEREDAISVASLFADVLQPEGATWSDGANIASALRLFSELIAVCPTEDAEWIHSQVLAIREILGPAYDVDLRELRVNSGPSFTKLLPQLAPEKVAVGLFICWWLDLDFHVPTHQKKGSDLIRYCGLEEGNYNSIIEQLHRAGFGRKPKVFLDSLASEPLRDPLYRDVGERHQNYLFRSNPRRSNWYPSCLQVTEADME